LALRARIVLMASEGWWSNGEIAEALEVSRPTVTKWRNRFAQRRLEGLADEPRPGKPRTIIDEQVERVVTKTLESAPKNATHWSTRSMAKGGRDDSGRGDADLARLWAAASSPGNLAARHLKPLRRAEREQRTVIGSLHQRHRAVEFLKFLQRIDQNIPGHLDVHLVLDNASSHKTPKIKHWLAAHPRFHLHFTPTSSSWINLVERWFGELTTKLLRRGAHRSVHALNTDIRQWIA
jgi:transposase/transposase-like protein